MIAFIDDHRGAYGVEPICKVLPIAPSTYHAQAARRVDPSLLPARAKRDASLMPQIARVFEENFEVYGVRKVWRQLKREGQGLARCTVERLMQTMGLQGAIRGKPVKTTISDKAGPCPLDHVHRQFQAPRPNALWVSDFTYVATWAGFVYVAFVIDTYARRIVGWRASRTAHTSFVLDALEQALHERRPIQRAGLVHHSDRGSQGEFNLSSQHPGKEYWDGRSASVGWCVAEQAVFAGTTFGRAAGAPSAFLGIDCGWPVERGRCNWRGCVGAGRSAVVSEGGRHATINACAIIEAVVSAIPFVCRAGGTCDPASQRLRGAGDRPANGAVGIDDLPRTPPQCCDAQRRPGISGHHGAVAC